MKNATLKLMVMGVCLGTSAVAWADHRGDAERAARRLEDQAEHFAEDVAGLQRGFPGGRELRTGAAQLHAVAHKLHGGLHQGAGAGSLLRGSVQAEHLIAQMCAVLDQVMTIQPHGPQFAPDPVRSHLHDQLDRMARTVNNLQAELRQCQVPTPPWNGGYGQRPGRPGTGYGQRPGRHDHDHAHHDRTAPVVVVPVARPPRQVFHYDNGRYTIRIER